MVEKAKKVKSVKAVKGKKAGAGFFSRRMKSVGWMSILESVIIGVLGIMLITHPTGILKAIFYIVGIFLMVKGVYKIVNYFAAHDQYDFYNNDLLYGIIALVFGVLCVVLWEKLGGAIGIVAGAWMIYGALVRLNTAIKLRKMGIGVWFYVMLLSMVMLALGIYIVLSLGIVIAVVGWVMLAAAVVGVVDDAMFLRHLDALLK